MEDDHGMDLMDFVLVLWKRKWLLIAITIGVACLGAFWAHRQPDLYRVSASVEPGIIDVNKEGRPVYVDSVENIKAKVDSRYYDQLLKDSLGKGGQGPTFDIKSDIPKNANLIIIYADVMKEDVDLCAKMIERLVVELQKNYKGINERKKAEFVLQKESLEKSIQEIRVRKKDLDVQIAQVKNDVMGFQQQQRMFHSTISVLEAREKDLCREILKSEKNSEKLVQGRDAFLKQHSSGNDPNLASILYTTTIQQNVSLTSELQKQRRDLQIKIEEVKGQEIEFQRSIEYKKNQIKALELEKDEQLDLEIARKDIDVKDMESKISSIQDINILSRPSATFRSAQPKRKMILIFSTIMGAFLGGIIVLLREQPPKPRGRS